MTLTVLAQRSRGCGAVPREAPREQSKAQSAGTSPQGADHVGNDRAVSSSLRKPLGTLTEVILHPGKRWMLPVLHFDPMPEPAATVEALPVFGDHALQSHQAGVPE
jgi:hypothetical protein